MKRLLIIEDDSEINELLVDLLSEIYEVETAFSGTEGLLLIGMKSFDMVILDIMLPGLTGTEVLKKVRETSQVPIIMLTAMNDKKLISETLLNGADDYLTKPFDVDELLARISVQFRKSQKIEHENKQILQYKNVELDLNAFKLRREEKTVDLSKKEAMLLELLFLHPSHVYTKEAIYKAVWDEFYMGDENTVNVHISNLRKKLGQLDAENDYIDTIWGIGIKLAE